MCSKERLHFFELEDKKSAQDGATKGPHTCSVMERISVAMMDFQNTPSPISSGVRGTVQGQIGPPDWCGQSFSCALQDLAFHLTD